MRISDWSSDVCSSDLASSHGAALHVLNISSGAAIRPLPGWGAYCASKAAIRHFFDVAEAEQTIDLSVRHFDPGVLDTRMQEQIRSSSSDDFPLVEKFVSLKMSGSLKSPMDVAIEIEESLLEWMRSEEHTSELQSLMRSSYAVFC